MFQAEYATEIVDIVDENDLVISTATREKAHKHKMPHRVVGLLLVDKNKKFVFQSGNKFGKLDMAVGGHVISGELPLAAISREAEEELGINIQPRFLMNFLSPNSKHAHMWHVYIAKVPFEWTFEPTSEVCSIARHPVADLVEIAKSNSETSTQGLINVLHEVLKSQNWQKVLDYIE